VSIFHPDRLPSLSRLPTELGRENRFCTACGEPTEHILYRVPKKVILVYVKNHSENVQATCMKCARSIVLTGTERQRVLSQPEDSS
jgi:5-methylcytosine-specific restriction endonuclease McrA